MALIYLQQQLCHAVDMFALECFLLFAVSKYHIYRVAHKDRTRLVAASMYVFSAISFFNLIPPAIQNGQLVAKLRERKLVFINLHKNGLFES